MSAYVLLGRNGDIINLLPVLRQKWVDSGEKPILVVAQEFIRLLEGVSYVDAVACPVHWRESAAGLSWARKRFVNVVDCTQRRTKQRVAKDYCREAWLQAGAWQEWGTLPLVFDRRSVDTDMLVRDSVENGVILCHFGGISSPFPRGVANDIFTSLPGLKYDCTADRLHYVFDMISMLDRAVALVCSDSVMLHLARAVPTLPIFAFICDGPAPWNQTPVWPQVVWHCHYKDAAQSIPSLLSSLHETLSHRGPALGRKA